MSTCGSAAAACGVADFAADWLAFRAAHSVCKHYEKQLYTAILPTSLHIHNI